MMWHFTKRARSRGLWRGFLAFDEMAANWERTNRVLNSKEDWDKEELKLKHRAGKFLLEKRRRDFKRIVKGAHEKLVSAESGGEL